MTAVPTFAGLTPVSDLKGFNPSQEMTAVPTSGKSTVWEVPIVFQPLSGNDGRADTVYWQRLMRLPKFQPLSGNDGRADMWPQRLPQRQRFSFNPSQEMTAVPTRRLFGDDVSIIEFQPLSGNDGLLSGYV